MDRSPPTEAELAAREASAPEPPLDPSDLAEPEPVYCRKHDLYDCWLAH